MRLGWAVSGRGMAARGIFEAQKAGLLTAELAVVILDRVTPMIDFCKENGIPVVICDAREVNSAALEAKVSYSIDWLALTFNRLLNQQAIDGFGGRIFNLHLSLLPLFPGFGATRKALVSGCKFAGTTVHLVDSGVDSGEILMQSICPIEVKDDVASLGKKQFYHALCLLLQVVRSVERGELTVTSSRAFWRYPRPPSSDLNPSVDRDLLEFASSYCERRI